MFASIARSTAPRGIRCLTTAARQTATSGSASQSANITTTAASISNPSSSAAQSHILSTKGSLKSAHRHFHANMSESEAGLSEMTYGASSRLSARMMRMREAKELAGL